jgi:hypothetical protein
MPRDDGGFASHRLIDNGRQSRLGILQFNLPHGTFRAQVTAVVI